MSAGNHRQSRQTYRLPLHAAVISAVDRADRHVEHVVLALDGQLGDHTGRAERPQVLVELGEAGDAMAGDAVDHVAAALQ